MSIHDLFTTHKNRLVFLDIVCLLSLLSLIMLAWYCSESQQNTIIENALIIGRSLLLFFLFGYTICGCLFLHGSKEDLFPCIIIWGSIQIISSLPMAVFIGNLSRSLWGNDGMGLVLVLFSPLIAICSFLLSCAFSRYFQNETVDNIIYARCICLLILVFWNIFILFKIN